MSDAEREPTFIEVLRTAPRGRTLRTRIPPAHQEANDAIREHWRKTRSGENARQRRAWPFPMKGDTKKDDEAA